MSTKRICLWSGPRNISTALMYSFAQRPDTTVFDEPLYGYYLKQTIAKEYHPGAIEVINSMECDASKVVDFMMGDFDSEVVFFKNMCHHLLDLDTSFMQDTINLILTRHPAQVITSFSKEIPNPSLLDIGMKTQAELLKELLDRKSHVLVIDSNELLKAPVQYLNLLFSKLNIPFYKEMLSWEIGPKSYDGPWAPHWYSNVHNSTGFQSYEEKALTVPEHLNDLLNEALPYYLELKKHSLTLV
jgi:hypothetical protein